MATIDISAAAEGFLLGMLYFGGLWLTVAKGLVSSRPGLLFLSSTILRTAAALGGFALISGGSLNRMLASVGGFSAAKLLTIRMSRYTCKPAISRKDGDPCI
jgi:F1F0 ATPase subunit 2